MSCYFRHLKNLLDEAGVVVTPDNKRQIDRAVHKIVGVEYKNCPVAWKMLKHQVLDDEQKRHDFIKKLKDSLS
jgi:hypothetical protein